MSSKITLNKFSFLKSYKLLKILLLIIIGILVLISLIFPITIRPTSYTLEIGNVSNQDIQAPRTLTFSSQELTNKAAKDAESLVPLVYLPADPAITRNQIEELKLAINYISTIRADEFSSNQQKISDLGNMNLLSIDEDSADQLLSISLEEWEAIQDEALIVLERIMRDSIRDDQLSDIKRNIPTLISFSFNQEQAKIIASLVTPFVIPTSLYSEELTAQNRDLARQKVEPVERKIIAGETIVKKGEIITPTTWEALNKYGLITPQNQTQKYFSATILVILLSVLTALYFDKRNLNAKINFRGLVIVSLVFLFFLYSARFTISNRTVLPYIFPLSAFGLMLASLFSFEIGILLSLVLSILVVFDLPNGMELTFFYFIPTLFGILSLGKGRRISSYFWSGLIISFVGIVIIIINRLPDNITDWFGIATLSGASIFNGVAAASVTLILQFFISQLLGITTSMQLLELSRPDHPLLQFIIRNAPGTYQHSLQVANLAEQAAEAISADTLLVRVGARYHDIGKAINPTFFIENQIAGSINPHEDLDNYESSKIIIRHVTDGVHLAKKYRIPERIQDFIREHHGTLITSYQYALEVQKNKNTSLEISEDLFRYPGPRPQSRETALLMLADKCEAKARAELPKNEEQIRTIVNKVIDFCMRENQLEDTDFTQRDLKKTADTFVSTLLNTYHPRILYPEVPRKVNTL